MTEMCLGLNSPLPAEKVTPLPFFSSTPQASASPGGQLGTIASAYLPSSKHPLLSSQEAAAPQQYHRELTLSPPMPVGLTPHLSPRPWAGGWGWKGADSRGGNPST